MNENLLEIHHFTGIGYKPIIDYGAWRVAILNYIDELIPDRVTRLERHNETDEVFVLLTGRAVLFIGAGEDEITDLTPYVMEPGKMYNVKSAAWHAVVLSEDASILLVENRNTGTANSDYIALSEPLCKILIEASLAEIQDA